MSSTDLDLDNCGQTAAIEVDGVAIGRASQEAASERLYAHDERLVGSVEQHALVLVVGGLDGLLEHRASDEMRRFDKLVRRHAPRELLVVVIVS